MHEKLQWLPPLSWYRDEQKEMQMNRKIKVKVIAICLLAMTLAASWPARANTIFLNCPGAPYGDTLSVDLTKNTVDNYPAIINATTIHWQHSVPCADCTASNPGTVTQVYYIDRTTGILKIYDEFNYQDGTHQRTGPFTHPCTVTHAPATKF
jgi:hypothetical protein